MKAHTREYIIELKQFLSLSHTLSFAPVMMMNYEMQLFKQAFCVCLLYNSICATLRCAYHTHTHILAHCVVRVRYRIYA